MKKDVENQMARMLGTAFLAEIPTIAKDARQVSDKTALNAAADGPEEKFEVMSVDFFYHKENNQVEAVIWLRSGVQMEYGVIQAELLQNDICIGTNTVAGVKPDTLMFSVHGTPKGNTVNTDDIKVRVSTLEKGRSMALSACENVFESSMMTGFDECIDRIEITDPVNKKTKQDSTIHVSFNRYSKLQQLVDYDYTSYWGSGGDQPAYLDMKGSIYLKPGYSYVENSFKTDKIFLRRNQEFLEYCNGEAKIDVGNDKSITYTYNNEWKTEFKRSVFGACATMDYRMSATLRCREDSSGKESTTMIVVSSQDYDNVLSIGAAPSNYKKIPNILFYWGCVEENTLITMADGSKKKIKEIQPGEDVLGTNGNAHRVADIMKGDEESLISIMVVGSTPILVTRDHPFMTKQGEKTALLLTAEDELLLEDGTYAAIEEVYLSEKKYSVYSLVLEPEGFFYGNGYAIGDSAAQGRSARTLADTCDFTVPEEILKECEKINQVMSQK
ncbi:MAG: hypothetical protein J1E98_00150 [Lachnospiraceae bacterium]|nr:hypothetical protein [Lachnospiraceae bacterium]